MLASHATKAYTHPNWFRFIAAYQSLVMGCEFEKSVMCEVLGMSGMSSLNHSDMLLGIVSRLSEDIGIMIIYHELS